MIIPVLHRVLVKPDPIEETDEILKKAKAMGLHLPEKEMRREQAAAEKGTIISLGSTAYNDFGADPELLPPGSKVFYAKYAGKHVTDTDGTEYILLNDEDIVGLIKE